MEKIKLAKEGFSFHTFQLTKSITYEEYRVIKDSIYESAKEEKHRVIPDKNCLVCDKYYRYGITIKLYDNPGKPPHFHLIVNPRLACGQYDYIGIFPCTQENIETVETKINEVLASIHTNYNFDDMTVSRIDLCVNLEMEQSMVDSYMRVIRKCKLSNSFHHVCFMKNEPNYQRKNKYSFRAGNRDTVFTIYDKASQLKQEKLLREDSSLQNGLIRFEVSLSRDAINRVNKEYFQREFSRNAEFLWAYGTLSKTIIRTYIVRFFPRGIYAPYEKVESVIRESHFSNKIERRMLFLLRKTSDCNDLSNAIRKMKFEFSISGYKVDKVLQAFEQINYNPVTTLGETLPDVRNILGLSNILL